MDQVLETIKRAHQGDKAARDRLVQENMPLVWSIVRRFSNRGYEPEGSVSGWKHWLARSRLTGSILRI
ncbi:MAG: hypothetical protein ACLTDV_01160 [Eubacterium sp.]